MRTVESSECAIVWLRRDLRLSDHRALSFALANYDRILPVFVFDTTILQPLAGRADRRVRFIHECLRQIEGRLTKLGRHLLIVHGDPRDEIPRLASEFKVAAVIAARDYEPAARERDRLVGESLDADGRALILQRDHAIFEQAEILTRSGQPYSVFTPYKRAWLDSLDDAQLAEHRVEITPSRLVEHDRTGIPGLAELGFEPDPAGPAHFPAGEIAAREALETFASRIGDYRAHRDYPAIRAPSYLSVHLRFGTLSIRAAARLARQTMASDPASADGAATWLSELIWRDFYFQILYHHPHVVDHAFRPAYDRIAWRDDEQAFRAWCEGRTGYPLVDAAMAQINQTGYMHNRLRMISASFLVKDLGIDWRRGEAYFARQLIDFDLAANNGGWQWAASTGCDAQPWFRIFNPLTQSRKFDPRGRFIRRYLPQLSALDEHEIHAPWMLDPARLRACGIALGENYPEPIVDHRLAREETLARYGRIGHATAATPR